MSNIIDEIDKVLMCDDIFEFCFGDLVKVYVKVVEGSCICVQVFFGIVILCIGGGVQEFFIVCKLSFGIGVECIFLLYFLIIDKIEVDCYGVVCCVKLYYLCGWCGKVVKIKERGLVC